MSSTFSPNLAIELIGTFDQAGSWGNTTNTNLGTLIEQAISGYVTQAVATGTDTTITIPNGATGVARNMYIELTGTGGASTNLIVPANKKLYFIFNNTSSGQVTVKVSGQTGISVPNGKKMVLVSNGTDIVTAENYVASLSSDNLSLTGTLAVGSTSTFTGAATFTANPVLNGGTANGVLYLNGSKVATSGSALTFDGTTVLTTPRINVTNTGIGATFSSSGGSGMRLYGSSGTNQWDIYLNGANVRFSDNTGGGVVKIDTGAVIDGNLGIGTASPESTGRLTLDRASFNQLFIKVGGVEELRFYADASLSSIACASNPLLFETAGGEKMRLDTSGNLGLGVTPSANGGVYYRGFELAKVGSGIHAATTSLTASELCWLTNNSYPTYSGGTVWKYGNDGPAARYALEDSAHTWFTAGSGTANNTISWGDPKMTLDASGNLSVGTTTNRGRITTSGSGDQTIYFTHSDNSPGRTVTLRLGNNDATYHTSSAFIRATQGPGIDYYNLSFGTSSGGAAQALMLLDGAGNLGVGTTSPSGRVHLATAAGTAPKLYIGQTATSAWSVGSPASVNALVFIDEQFSAERARITSDGKFISNAAAARISVEPATGTNSAFVSFVSSAGANGSYVGIDSSVGGLGTGGYSMALWHGANYPLVFATNNTERGRFTSDGNFYVNTTGAGGKVYVVSDLTANNGLRVDVPASFTASAIALVSATAAGAGWYFLTGESSGGSARIQIRGDGNVYNANGTYGTISDERLKQDIVDAGSQWDDLKAIRFRKYRMKSDVEADPNAPALFGVVAQELEQVCPGLVDDGEIKRVKSSILLMKAAKALQEAMARIESLEADVAALKGAK